MLQVRRTLEGTPRQVLHVNVDDLMGRQKLGVVPRVHGGDYRPDRRENFGQPATVGCAGAVKRGEASVESAPATFPVCVDSRELFPGTFKPRTSMRRQHSFGSFQSCDKTRAV
jgi:hypothetical protein